MKIFVFLLHVVSLGLAAASPDAYASNYGYYSAPQPLPSSQFHAQDDIGQYNYGYQGDTSAKEEFKTADGVVRGSYSYVDANGIIQTTNYIADALGFRVAATNLPVHIVDEAHADVAVEAAVAAAPIAVAPAVQVAPVVEAAPSGPAVVSTYGYSGHGTPYGVYGYGAANGVYGYGGVVRPNPTVDYAYLPYATGYNYHQVPTQYINTYGQSIQEAPIVQVAPATAAQFSPYAAPVAAPYVAPVAAPAPVVYTTAEAAHHVVPVVQGPAHTDSSQYHAQDDFGQYSFGYNDPNSVRQEVKTADGVVRGAYRYVDANGKIQTVEYIADAGGFRVAATNLPVHDVGVVQDTPAVAAAKAGIAARVAAPVVVDSFVVSPSAPAVNAAAAQVLPAPTVFLQPAPYVIPAPAPVAETYVHQEIAAEPYVHQEIAAEPYVDAQIVAEPYVHAEVSAEPYVHTEFAAEPYIDAQIAAEPYVHAEVAAEPYLYVAGVPAPIALSYVPVAASAAPLPISAPAPVVYQTPVVHAAPLPIGAPVVHAAPLPVAASGSQYHAQDDIGQYSFGYSDQNSVKQELRTADGVVRGSYSYVDSNGIIQTVNYIADALGFRVGATNLPVHHVDAPEASVAAAPVEVVAVAAAPVATPVVAPASYYAPALAPHVSYSYLPYASNYGYSAQHYAHTVPYATPAIDTHTVPYGAPAVAVAPEASAIPAPIVTGASVDAFNSQFHAQDDIGQYNYGFSNPTQHKEEIKTADGVTRGSYSYIDANGLIQTVNYISDAMGFRVAATNLPVHHVEGEAATAVVEEAPAVAAGYSIISPSVNYAYLPYATNYGYHQTAPQAA